MFAFIYRIPSSLCCSCHDNVKLNEKLFGFSCSSLEYFPPADFFKSSSICQLFPPLEILLNKDICQSPVWFSKKMDRLSKHGTFSCYFLFFKPFGTVLHFFSFEIEIGIRIEEEGKGVYAHSKSSYQCIQASEINPQLR